MRSLKHPFPEKILSTRHPKGTESPEKLRYLCALNGFKTGKQQ